MQPKERGTFSADEEKSLNEMIDQQTTRVSAPNNRVPSAIVLVEVIGAATALGLMAPLAR